jgi:hemerythrin-like domain-containing protein
MTQPIRLSSLVSSPAAGFEEPFGMLAACHERMDRMLRLLARLRGHVRAQGNDAQARQAARDVMRYFDMAAPQHHLDEELHVFPPLLEGGDPALAAVVRRLQQDHLAMEARWKAAREVLALLAQGEVDRLGEEDESRLDAFAGLYAEHVRAEEDIAYPAAERALDATRRSAMGEEMSRRRGLK